VGVVSNIGPACLSQVGLGHIMVWDQHQILGCKFGWGYMPSLACFSRVWNINIWLGQLICILLTNPLTRI